jgi:hypothetical protein
MAAARPKPWPAQARAWTRLECKHGAGTCRCLPMAEALGSPGRLHDCRGPHFSPFLSDSRAEELDGAWVFSLHFIFLLDFWGFIRGNCWP